MINNTKTSFWVAIIMTVTLIQSCSVQQRRYTGGLSIQWPSVGKSQQKSTEGTLHSYRTNEEAAHHPLTQPQASIETQDNYRQEIGVNNHPFLKQFFTISEAKTLSRQRKRRLFWLDSILGDSSNCNCGRWRSRSDCLERRFQAGKLHRHVDTSFYRFGLTRGYHRSHQIHSRLLWCRQILIHCGIGAPRINVDHWIVINR